MKENEAISRMRYRVDTATHNIGKGVDGKAYEDMEMAIKALEEIQQYRVIGTVEECREVRERQRAKKPILSAPCKSINYYLCPNCNKILNINKPFCCDCGSGIDWSEEDV